MACAIPKFILLGHEFQRAAGEQTLETQDGASAAGEKRLNIPRAPGGTRGVRDQQDTSSQWEDTSSWEELERIQPDTAQTLKSSTPPLALHELVDSLS